MRKPQLTVSLPDDLRAAVEAEAEKQDRSLAWVIREALRQWLEKQPKR